MTGISRASAATLLWLSVAGTACLHPMAAAPNVPEAGVRDPSSFALPMPTSDEVALVDGRPLSISGFIALRTALGNPSVETTFWIATAALALENDSRSHGAELSPGAAVMVARYAVGEIPKETAEPYLREYESGSSQALTSAELRRQIERLLARSVVQRNPQVLAGLH
jgi:hypothetical protein